MKSNEVRSNFLAGEKFARVTAPAGITPVCFGEQLGEWGEKEE